MVGGEGGRKKLGGEEDKRKKGWGKKTRKENRGENETGRESKMSAEDKLCYVSHHTV